MSGAKSKETIRKTRSQRAAVDRQQELSAAEAESMSSDEDSSSSSLDDQQQLPALSKFMVWYRHSGEEEIDAIPARPELKEVTDYNEITASIGSHHITHMWIELLGEVMPPVHVISPHLTHLRIEYVRERHNLSCIKELTQLQVLEIERSHLSPPTLQAISTLSELRKLVLDTCELADLPQSFSKLQNLVKLDVGYNEMSGRLPPVIYPLSSLQDLNIGGNTSLVEIESDILKLRKLKVMNCRGCSSLQSPPYAVCQQGLPAIKKYFEDLIHAAGTEVTVVPVAVVGNLMAGKTSLIRSLISGKRELTFRQESSPLDEATRVFKMETLALTDCTVRFIDFGGHQVYQIAYQLTLKEQCIPTFVVNLEEYHKLSRKRGANEATKRLCIDWLSHLYLACPRLGAPILVLTHRDKLSDEGFKLCRNQLLNSAEAIRTELLEEENEVSEGDSEFCKIVHLSDTDKPLFHSDDIFVFGNKTDTNTNLQSLKECLDRRSHQFKVTIPRSWELVNSYIDEQTSKAYLQLSDIKAEFAEDDQMEVILRYLHNSGRVLWFENKPTLSMYLFHQIPKIVDMIALLFHHSGDEKWRERTAKVTAFKHKKRIIEKATYEHMVKKFRESGVMDEAILTHLLKTETNFSVEVAFELLRSFYISHGPINENGRDAYIIPYFSSMYMDRQWQTDGNIQLRVEIRFNGLPLPRYVFQLITVAVLRFRSDPTNSVNVANNGATIRHGRSATHLVHDYYNSKVTLQVSTPVELIGSSWQRLIELTQHVVDSTTSLWKASRPEVVVYCSHCLFKRVDNPDYEVDPSWFSPPSHTAHHMSDGSQLPSVTTFIGMEPVRCRNAEPNSNGEHTVPKPLRFPCYQLTTKELARLNQYLSTLQQRHPPSRTGPQSTDPQAVGTQATSTQSTVPQATSVSNEADSDISDVEDEGYLDFSNTDNVHVRLDLKPCTKQSVASLYLNSDKVYEMVDGVRGRALILNNRLFRDNPRGRRSGDEVDYANVKRMFEEMNFEIAKTEEDLTDLTAEEMLEEIQEESTLDVHHRYSMFVIVICSHGESADRILCHDNKYVDLSSITRLLSASKFPAMKGKPKLVIVQACSGGGRDYGDSKHSNPTSLASATDTIESDVPVDEATAVRHSASGDVTLDSADFFIMKASTESYVALRSHTHGSHFIRILVATFYRHSCHRDLESLFKIIQERVRRSTSKRNPDGSWHGGVIPESRCTFTNYRKLYFFPKFSLKNGSG